MGAITRLIEVLRTVVNGIPDRPLRPFLRDYPLEATDTAVGRYIYVTVGEDRFRVYYEEAGQGTPLLLQHTAGADSREWRHLLADPEMQKRYRMIAYDLPFHGRSLPPLTGQPWWEHEYAPSKKDLHAWIVGIKRALDLDRPIFMGVSMGGHLAPEMIGHFPDDFRAAVAVNGFYHMDALADFTNEPYHHPRISPEYFAARMYPLTSRDGPEAFRREVVWIYASNGPAVYKGDNEYFIRGHDLRIDGHLIDTRRTPLAVLAGSEDVSLLPGTEDSGSRALAASIPGARFKMLEGMSHFAMADDPFRFNALIKPVLDELDDASAGSSRVNE
jgi:pimeloyl-ACP methyl ester carboxylesterase